MFTRLRQRVAMALRQRVLLQTQSFAVHFLQNRQGKGEINGTLLDELLTWIFLLQFTAVRRHNIPIVLNEFYLVKNACIDRLDTGLFGNHCLLKRVKPLHFYCIKSSYCVAAPNFTQITN